MRWVKRWSGLACSEITIELITELRNELRRDPNQLSLILVTGESIEPSLHSGDIILVDCILADSITNGIWVYSMGDGPIVKRVQRLSKNKVKIISDNKTYEPMDINLQNLPEGMRFIGRVVWCGKRM